MKKNSFVGGTIIATLSIVITKILGILYVIPFYKMIGVMGSALYAYAYNIYVIFLDISTCGLPIAISKVVNEYDTLGNMDKKKQTYYVGNRIMGIVAIVVFIVLFSCSRLIAKLLVGDLENGNSIGNVSIVIKCISLSLLIVPFLSVSKGYLQGHNIMKVSGISQIIEQVVRVVIVLLGTFIVLYIFNGSITLAVCVSLLGAFFGALISYLYVRIKIGKIEVKKVIDKIILKKIIRYAIPFIIINVVSSLYNFVDMTIILKTLKYVGYETYDIEFLCSAVTTWAPKINMIVTSLAMGMSMSLIPTIVSSFTKKDFVSVNKNVNQAIEIVLFISLPLVIAISMVASDVWNIFYGYNYYGGSILKLNIFMGLLINLFMILSSTLQGLNSFKLVYISTLVGFFINAFLDVPFIIILSKYGIGYLGSIVSSMVGYSLSIIIALWGLKKECNVDYMEIKIFIKKLIIPLIIEVVILFVINHIRWFSVSNKILSFLYVGSCGLICFGIYIVVCYKMGIVTKIFGSGIIKKLTFGKIS